MTYRYWQHDTSGELYAVGMGCNGIITGVCGPLHYSERTHPLDSFEYDSEDIDWLTLNSGHFRDVTTPAEHIPSNG